MKTDKHVLYLSYDGLTDMLGQSQILPYVTGLADAGYSFTVISFEKADKFTRKEADIRRQCKQHNIEWIPLPYHRRPPILSTVYDLIQLRRTCRRVHKHKPVALVHCRSYITSLVGLWMKKKFKVRFIFDMRGFWADERVEGGLWNIGNPLFRIIYSFFKRKESEFLREADSIIVLTEAAKKELLSWKVLSPIATIPCCVDLEMFDANRFTPESKTSLRSQLGIGKNTYVLLYLGSIGTWYQWDAMVSFFDNISAQREDSRFLVVTPDVDRVEQRDDFTVLPAAREEVPAYISISDASVCFITPKFSKKGSSATKMAEVLAMHVPVITNSGWGDVDSLRTQINNLWVVSPNDEEPKMIEKLLQEESSTQCAFFYDFFSLAAGINKYGQVYESVFSRNS
jgi:glycosyltransferase involved in cell wall biosynthesis